MDIKYSKADPFKVATSTTETKATEGKKADLITAVVAESTAPKASASTVKSAKAEFQFAASAQQAHLNNQLGQKVSDKTELFAQNKTAPEEAASVQNQLAPLEIQINTLMHQINQLEQENSRLQDELKQSQEAQQSAVESNLEKAAESRDEIRRATELLS